MSQRLHSCANNMNFDPVNCEAYSSTLQQRRKEKFASEMRNFQAPRRERSVSRTRCSNVPQTVVQQQQQQQAPSVKSRTTNVRRQNENLRNNENTRSGESQNGSSVIHKELYTDNPALVEVTVKTHNAQHNSRSNSTTRREPWSKLLKPQTSFENISSFYNFDPLRTLHFLAKELQNKLIDFLPNDKNVQQMVLDMQLALSRIPPEIASQVALHTEILGKKSNTDVRIQKQRINYAKDECDFPVVQFVKPTMVEKGCQTVRCNYAEAEKLQKHLEESSAKIETACKQMESVCTKLKSEKEELEVMLRAERETVKFLRKQMEECENEKIEAENNKITTLQHEKEALQNQVKKLKLQLESQHDANSQELRATVQELQKQKSEVDERVTILTHQITLSNMEKEKYVAILAARDRQIKEIRTEMAQLQEVVNDQLLELQNAPSSVTSSVTNITQDWMAKSHLLKTNDISEVSETPTNNSETPQLRQLYTADQVRSFKERSSGDIAGSLIPPDKQREKKHDGYRMQPDKSLGKLSERSLDVQMNIRDMFAEIKKQALMVTSESCNVGGTDMYRGENVKK